MIDLIKEIGVTEDKNAKTLSYFCNQDPIKIDARVIEQLLEVSGRQDNCDARISLHKGPNADFHEMIILQHRGRYYRPHTHPTKGESCHVIQGKVACFVFNDDGSVADCSVIGGEIGVLYRSESNRWHTVIPISEFAVYHESKPGPYLSQGDSVYPEWAPDGTDEAEAQRYIEVLLSGLKDSS